MPEKLISDDMICTAKLCGNVVEIKYCSMVNTHPVMRMLDGDHMVDTRDGCVIDIKHADSRADSLKEVRRSLARLRELINTNCSEPSRIRWLTLTYAENMRDLCRLHDDFKRFMQRLRRKYGACEYISAIEPQRRGAWHIHAILIYPDKAPFLLNSTVAQMWGQGFIRVTAVDEIDNLGAYLSAYLADYLPSDLDDGGSGSGSSAQDGNNSKRAVKGMRLHMYPPNTNIYRCSKGIKDPEVVHARAVDIKNEYARDAALTYSKQVEVPLSDDTSVTVITEYYNTRRKA